MRKSYARYTESMARFVLFLATLMAGMAFVLVTSANAAPEDKKFDVKKPEVAEKVGLVEKSSSDAFFVRRPFFNNDFGFRPFFNPRPFGFRPFFINPFFEEDDFFVNRFDFERDDDR